MENLPIRLLANVGNAGYFRRVYPERVSPPVPFRPDVRDVSSSCTTVYEYLSNHHAELFERATLTSHWRDVFDGISKEVLLVVSSFFTGDELYILELLKTARYLWYEGLRIRKIIFLIPSQEMDSYILERRGVVDYIDLKNKISTINSHLLFILLKIYPTYYSMKRSF